MTDIDFVRSLNPHHHDRDDIARSMVDFDDQKYRPYLDGLDLTDAQASELMRVVWSIMRMFVELRLPVDSCGQIVQKFIEQSAVEPDSLD